MTVPGLVVPVDVAVVDPDLLWRVEVMNALDRVMAKDVVTVFGAMAQLTADHPAVVVLGPAASVASSAQLHELRAAFPGVRVVAVEGTLIEAELGFLTDTPFLSLVPDLPAEESAKDLTDDPDDESDPHEQPSFLQSAPARGAERRNDEATDEGTEEGDEPGQGDGEEHAEGAEPVDIATLVDRVVATGTSLDSLVAIIHEELALARRRAELDDTGTVYRTLVDTQIIVVTSAKGGDGATTVAANLAAALAQSGRAVGLVEGDPVFGDLALVLALPLAPPGVAVDPETGIRLVMPARPEEAFAPIDVDLLCDQLSETKPPFDVVVIEAPPSIADRSGLARMADHLLVVCSSHLSSIKNAVILIDLLDQYDNLGVVVNRVGRKSLPRRELESALGGRLVAQLPVTPELEADRPDQPPALASPTTAFSEEIARLAATLTPADRKS